MSTPISRENVLTPPENYCFRCEAWFEEHQWKGPLVRDDNEVKEWEHKNPSDCIQELLKRVNRLEEKLEEHISDS